MSLMDGFLELTVTRAKSAGRLYFEPAVKLAQGTWDFVRRLRTLLTRAERTAVLQEPDVTSATESEAALAAEPGPRAVSTGIGGAVGGAQLTALVVMPKERGSRLLGHLSAIDANILTASSCGEAAELLQRAPDIRLVLTDLVLPDGSWCDVLSEVGDLNSSAHVVVCARVADERLWRQVLAAGGFEVLVEPYQEGEVRRIFAAAAHDRYRVPRTAS